MTKWGACAGPLRSTSSYRGGARARDWAHSCTAVLASRAGSASAVTRSPQARRISASAAGEAAVDEHRANQRFTDIGEDGGLLAAPAARFAEAQRHMRADVPKGRDLGAGFSAHELGEAHRELPFARLRKGLIEAGRNHDAEHPVAQELEPLIGLGPALPGLALRRKMGEREHGEGGIAEAVAEPRFQRGQFGARLLVHGSTESRMGRSFAPSRDGRKKGKPAGATIPPSGRSGEPVRRV